MYVWIVEYHNYDESGFVGAYTTKKKAQLAVEAQIKLINKETVYPENELTYQRSCYGIFKHKLDSGPF